MTSESDLIAARQERYRQAHNTLEVPALLAWMSDKIDYSDNGIGVAHLNKTQVEELAISIFASVKDMIFTTVSLNGDKRFTTWEWTAKGVITKEVPGVDKKVGEEFDSVGVSLFWWAGEGDEDKIDKLTEYSKIF